MTINYTNVAIIGGVIITVGIITYLAYRYNKSQNDKSELSGSSSDHAEDEESMSDDGSLEEVKEEEGTLSDPASGVTKQTEEGLQIERSGSEDADTQPLNTEKIEGGKDEEE